MWSVEVTGGAGGTSKEAESVRRRRVRKWLRLSDI